MIGGEGGREAFIVASETAEASRPSKRAFDDPALWKQDEAELGLGQFYDFELDLMSCRRGRRTRRTRGPTGIAMTRTVRA